MGIINYLLPAVLVSDYSV